jgi:hypothetical protein
MQTTSATTSVATQELLDAFWLTATHAESNSVTPDLPTSWQHALRPVYIVDDGEGHLWISDRWQSDLIA